LIGLGLIGLGLIVLGLASRLARTRKG
jgi:hypothetical protein